MNRKNIILAAVGINVAILALLFLAALNMKPEPVSLIAKEEKEGKPEESPLYQEMLPLVLVEPAKANAEPPIDAELLHPLPPLVRETALPSSNPNPVAPIPNAAFAWKEITVQKGDSLEKIAKAHRTSVDEIVKLNQLPNSFLKIGQVLKIPAEKAASFAKVEKEKPKEPSFEYYTIKVGENPWSIALRHQMKLEDLLKLNGLNEEKARKLKPGDRLRIR